MTTKCTHGIQKRTETRPPITSACCADGTPPTTHTAYTYPPGFVVHALFMQTVCTATAHAAVLTGRKKSRWLKSLLRKNDRRSLSLHFFGKIVQSYTALFTTPPPLGWRLRSLRAVHSCTLRPTGLVCLHSFLLLVAPHFISLEK